MKGRLWFCSSGEIAETRGHFLWFQVMWFHKNSSPYDQYPMCMAYNKSVLLVDWWMAWSLHSCACS